MSFRRPASALLATIWLFGCATHIESGPGDSGAEVSQTATITSFTFAAEDSWWRYDVRLEGWADRVELHIAEQSTTDEPDWTEDHSLIQGPFDAHGAWDSFGITLPIVLNANNQMANRNTACEAADEPLMTWMVAAFSGGFTADCIVAAGSKATTDTWSDYGCR
jgi:hypothetical protein